MLYSEEDIQIYISYKYTEKAIQKNSQKVFMEQRVREGATVRFCELLRVKWHQGSAVEGKWYIELATIIFIRKKEYVTAVPFLKWQCQLRKVVVKQINYYINA